MSFQAYFPWKILLKNVILLTNELLQTFFFSSSPKVGFYEFCYNVDSLCLLNVSQSGIISVSSFIYTNAEAEFSLNYHTRKNEQGNFSFMRTQLPLSLSPSLANGLWYLEDA